MKRFFTLLLVMVSCGLAPVRSVAATTSAEKAANSAKASSPAKGDSSVALNLARTVTTVTGVAISPLLGTAAYGAYEYVTTKDPEARARLPWFAQMTFWIPALLLVAAVALKDSLGATTPPGWKKPLDILETIENKVSGLVAAGAVVPFTMGLLTDALRTSGGGPEAFSTPTGVAMIHLASMDFTWLLNLLTIPLGIAVFAVVWMTSHAINVLILLSPWGAIDAALKAARTAVLCLLTITATLDPKWAAVLSLVIIVISYFVAGWSFRLTIFGTAFSWDFFTLRGKRFALKPVITGNKLFSGQKLTGRGVPVRTFGRLKQLGDGRMKFFYRPWLILHERDVDVLMGGEAHLGRGLFFSTIRDGDKTMFLLPPRYRGHEEDFAKAYNLPGGVKDAGLLRAWGSLRELFGGSAAHAQVA